jgi:serine/threonine protein kinase/Flp pilus assembly protein TadD
MGDRRTDRIRALFDQALSLDGSARRSFLERECADDPEILRRVQDLLAVDPRTGDLPVTPLLDADAAVVPPRAPGYRIVGELGAGGMGVVYEAEQEEPRRRVALKLIGSGFSDPVRIRMFRREIETLARLEHPCIARILESGQAEDGRLFFTMELVRGVPLDRHLARAFETGAPSRAAIAENLRLFARICDAVHFAHQRGVIHRDLKPSNLLVVEDPGDSGPAGGGAAGGGSAGGGAAGGGAPASASRSRAGGPTFRILDFGLARITDPDSQASLVTEVGAIRGTLQYMSPEQADGDPAAVDVRTDVYSLGVILYQLLTNRLPYDVRGASLLEAVRRIRETVPPPPRQAVPGLDPDLEVIAAKALEKDAALRYPSAHALGEDVTRHLGSLPILARPPSTLYQLRKLVRRHRGPFAAGATLLVALIVFAVSMGVLYSRAERNLRRAVAAEAATAREAETSRRVSDFLTELFTVPDPEVSRGDEITARALLDEGARRIRDELGDEPEVRARLQGTMGNTYLGLGLYDSAGELYDRATETLAALHGENSVEVAPMLIQKGWVTYSQGDPQAAAALARRALDIQIHATGEESPETAEMWALLGASLHNSGESAPAESALVRALEITEHAEGPDAELTARACNNLARVYLEVGRTQEAEPIFLRALDIRSRLYGEDHPDLAGTLSNLGELYRREERYEEAEAAFLRSLEIGERMLGPDHVRVAYAHNNLGLLYRVMDRPADAEHELRRAVEIRRARLAPDHPMLAHTLDNLALLYLRTDRPDDAEPVLEEVVAIGAKAFGPDSPDYGFFLSNVAWMRELQGRWDEELAARRQVLAIYESAYGEDHPRLIAPLRHLARNLDRLGRPREAIDPLRRAAALLEAAADDRDADLLESTRAALDDVLSRTGAAAVSGDE